MLVRVGFGFYGRERKVWRFTLESGECLLPQNRLNYICPQNSLLAFICYSAGEGAFGPEILFHNPAPSGRQVGVSAVEVGG